MTIRFGRLLTAIAALALAGGTLSVTPAAANEPTSGPTSSAGSGGALRYFDAAATPDGGTVVAGWIDDGGNVDGIVRKLDPNGGVEWSTNVGDPGAADWFSAVDVAEDGTVFAAGQTRGDVGGRIGGTDFDATLVKLSANGAVQWSRQLGNNGTNRDDRSTAVAAAPDGGVFVAAKYSTETAAVTARYTSDGTQQWLFATGEPGDVVEDVSMLDNDAFFAGVRYDGADPVEGFLWSQSPAGTFSSDTRMPGVTTMRVDTLVVAGLPRTVVAGGDDYLGTFGIFGLGEEQLDTAGRTITDVAIEQDGSLLILDDGSAILRGYDVAGNAEPWSKNLAGEAAGGRIVATSDGGVFATTPSDASFTTNHLAHFTDSATDGTVAGFTDIAPGIWYAEPVTWLKGENITQGTSETTFSPDANVTRAQMAAFLWRLAGEPTSNPAHGFGDVPAGAWYDEPVKWLKDQGITQGTSADTYSPGANVTRAQMAAFLFRMATDSDWEYPGS